MPGLLSDSLHVHLHKRVTTWVHERPSKFVAFFAFFRRKAIEEKEERAQRKAELLEQAEKKRDTVRDVPVEVYR